MNISTLSKNNWYTYGLLVFIAAIYTQPSQYFIQADIDGGMVWAVNEFFEFRQTHAFYYPLTNGPLNILRLPTDKDFHILAALIFQFSSRFLLGHYLIQLTQKIAHDTYYKTIFIYLFLLSVLNIDFVVIGLVLAAAYLVLLSKKTLPFLPSGIILSCGLFIKGSISFPVAGIFISLLLILFFTQRNKLAFKLIGLQLLLFLLCCTILYVNPLDGVAWFLKAMIGSFAYGSTQAIYFNNTLPLLIPALILILIIPYFFYKKEHILFYFLSVIVIFIFWKYVLGRQDFTHYRTWSLMCFLFIGFSFLLYKSQIALRLASCYFLSFLFFTTNTQRADSPKAFKLNTLNLTSFARGILKPHKQKQEFAQASNRLIEQNVLSDTMLQLIGNQSVDVFPWEHSIIGKYRLHYKPRPNFYSTLLGPAADQSDADHYASTNAPEFIIWHQSEPDLYKLNSHNSIYLPNTVPKAIKSIHQHYKLLLENNKYSLWQKSSLLLREEKLRNSSTREIKFNTWFDAPAFDSLHTIIANTNFQLSAADKLRSLMYKGRFFSIMYKLKNGSKIIHRLNLSSLQNHFVVQPYFTNPSMDYEVIDQIKIEPMAEKYKYHKMELEWQTHFAEKE